jgi:hypothetical protein
MPWPVMDPERLWRRVGLDVDHHRVDERLSSRRNRYAARGRRPGEDASRSGRPPVHDEVVQAGGSPGPAGDVPLIVFHGPRDRTMPRVNAAQLIASRIAAAGTESDDRSARREPATTCRAPEHIGLHHLPHRRLGD